jgi:hypothetical protein
LRRLAAVAAVLLLFLTVCWKIPLLLLLEVVEVMEGMEGCRRGVWRQMGCGVLQQQGQRKEMEQQGRRVVAVLWRLLWTQKQPAAS